MEAWRVYGFVATRFVADFHALPFAMELLGLEMTRREALILWAKLNIIHSEFTKREDEDG